VPTSPSCIFGVVGCRRRSNANNVSPYPYLIILHELLYILHHNIYNETMPTSKQLLAHTLKGLSNDKFYP